MLGFSSISEVAFAQLPGAFVPLTGQVGTMAVGSVGITAFGAADPIGVSATATLGTLSSVTGDANVSISGLSLLGQVGNETVWGMIIPAPGNSYTSITTGASQSWTSITTGASQTWTDVIQ